MEAKMTRNEIAQYVLESLKKAGADKAACTVSCGKTDELNIEANKFTLMRTLFNDSLIIKAIKENRKGIIHINKLDKDSIDKAVTDCIVLASSAMPEEAEDIAEKHENKTLTKASAAAKWINFFPGRKNLSNR